MTDFLAGDSRSYSQRELLHDDDGTGSKVMQELHLLGDGISAGFVARSKNAGEHWALTGLEILGTAVIGAGLTVMNEAGGKLGLAAKCAGYFLAATAGGDIVRRGIPTVGAMRDAWSNPKNYDVNKAVVAKNLGSAFFDYPLMAASGTAGSLGAKFGLDFLSPTSSPALDIKTDLGPSNVDNTNNFGARGDSASNGRITAASLTRGTHMQLIADAIKNAQRPVPDFESVRNLFGPAATGEVVAEPVAEPSSTSSIAGRGGPEIAAVSDLATGYKISVGEPRVFVTDAIPAVRAALQWLQVQDKFPVTPLYTSPLVANLSLLCSISIPITPLPLGGLGKQLQSVKEKGQN